jgi:hypothetical protein
MSYEFSLGVASRKMKVFLRTSDHRAPQTSRVVLSAAQGHFFTVTIFPAGPMSEGQPSLSTILAQCFIG